MLRNSGAEEQEDDRCSEEEEEVPVAGCGAEAKEEVLDPLWQRCEDLHPVKVVVPIAVMVLVCGCPRLHSDFLLLCLETH